jgi:hypothetical protein
MADGPYFVCRTDTDTPTELHADSLIRALRIVELIASDFPSLVGKRLDKSEGGVATSCLVWPITDTDKADLAAWSRP